MRHQRLFRPIAAFSSRPLIAATVLGLLAAAAGAAPAGASPASTAALRPGQHWSRVTATGLSNSSDIGLVRGHDGVLHVLWTTGSTGTFRVMDTPITAAGAVGHAVTIASKLRNALDPDATWTPTGLDAFWNGQKTSSVSHEIGTYEATRPVKGGSWRVAGITRAVDIYWQSSDAAATGKDGRPWVTFGYGGGIGVLHYGRPEHGLSLSACCVYDEGIGTDSRSGTAWLTYFSLVAGHSGIYEQQLAPSGTPAGPARRMPGSSSGGHTIGIGQRVAATGLGSGKPGVYSTYLNGYPNARAVDLYRLGSPAAIAVAKVSAGSQIGGSTVAADPRGRLWVAWFGGTPGSPTLFVRRSAGAANGFGKVLRVPLPAGTSALYKVYLSAQSGRLDVLALLIVNFKIAYWTTQVLAPR
jgi:hypothetical protein